MSSDSMYGDDFARNASTISREAQEEVLAFDLCVAELASLFAS